MPRQFAAPWLPAPPARPSKSSISSSMDSSPIAIGRAFFPATDPAASLLASFATFAVGFLFRPVGAIVIGYYGDRYGRRKALVVTIGMMACATGITGLIPSYLSIGLWAPILLVICRMLQGFSTGGEWGGAAAFLVEHAPAGRRGFIGSFQQAATAIGAMGATFSAAILSSSMSSGQLLHLGLAHALPDRLRARSDRLLPAHPRGGDAGLPARGRDADDQAHADRRRVRRAWRHVPCGVRPVDHRLRHQLCVPGVPAELRIADAEDRSQSCAVVNGTRGHPLSRADADRRALLRSRRTQADVVRLLAALAYHGVPAVHVSPDAIPASGVCWWYRRRRRRC